MRTVGNNERIDINNQCRKEIVFPGWRAEQSVGNIFLAEIINKLLSKIKKNVCKGNVVREMANKGKA